MLTGSDMLDVEPSPGQRVLRHSAILAAFVRPLPHELAEPRIHNYAPFRASTPRALACKMPMKSIACT
jgi:hypothetical protein